MNCVKWRTSRLVSDSVLPRLHNWSATLVYPLVEPFRLPLPVSETVYTSTLLLHFRCLSSGHVSRLISSPFPIPVHDHVQFSCSDTCHLDTLIVHVTYFKCCLWCRREMRVWVNGGSCCGFWTRADGRCISPARRRHNIENESVTTLLSSMNDGMRLVVHRHRPHSFD